VLALYASAVFARVAELADAYGSGPYGETRGGSSPLASIFLRLVKNVRGGMINCSKPDANQS
jgi:hypothetical protein